jgi:hypothetical protein
LNSWGIRGSRLLRSFAETKFGVNSINEHTPSCGELPSLSPVDLKMGSEPFQIRVLVRGAPLFARPLRGVLVALWGSSDIERPQALRLRELGHVGRRASRLSSRSSKAAFVSELEVDFSPHLCELLGVGQ